MSTPEAAPGWYGDPVGARVLRWWNGQEWTDDIAARGYEPLPSELLEKERQWATRAHYALIGVVLVQILVAVLYIWFVRRIVDEIDAAIDSDGDDPFEFGSETLAFQLLAPIGIGVWVLVYLWVHAAATYSRAVGLPARRDPGLAVASFLIPIVNLWWPYQSIRDTLPSEHSVRRRVLRWWLLNLGVGLVVLATTPVAFIPGAAGYLVAMGAVAAIATPMAVVGQAMIADIVAVHEQLLIERRLTASVSAGWGASVS